MCGASRAQAVSRAGLRELRDAARGSNICFDVRESDGSSRGFAACGARCGSTWALLGRRICYGACSGWWVGFDGGDKGSTGWIRHGWVSGLRDEKPRGCNA
ncbi:hypothetical protein B0H13DRAFT_1883595 [Mycena leptocephala]|nr:hypothetical protein B0H13DRAFT_1883595 [Mycena leptocephala]